MRDAVALGVRQSAAVNKKDIFVILLFALGEFTIVGILRSALAKANYSIVFDNLHAFLGGFVYFTDHTSSSGVTCGLYSVLYPLPQSAAVI